LGAEERIAGGTGEKRHPPLDEFIKRAETEDGGDYEEIEPARIFNDVQSKQNFPAPDRRNKALREVADFIVIVARKTKNFLHPKSQRRLGIGCPSAVRKNHGMDGDERVAYIAQWKSPIGDRDCNRPQHRRKNLQAPGKNIIGAVQRPSVKDDDDDEEEFLVGCEAIGFMVT